MLDVPGIYILLSNILLVHFWTHVDSCKFIYFFIYISTCLLYLFVYLFNICFIYRDRQHGGDVRCLEVPTANPECRCKTACISSCWSRCLVFAKEKRMPSKSVRAKGKGCAWTLSSFPPFGVFRDWTDSTCLCNNHRGSHSWQQPKTQVAALSIQAQQAVLSWSSAALCLAQ